MQNEILYSLKPQYAELIFSQSKNHEFRSVKPKTIPRRIWFYVTNPISELKYIVDVDKIITYPNKILLKGVGNEEFNVGNKESDFAYHIKHLYQIKNSLSLKELKEKFNFTAPQGFTYLSKYPNLYEYVLKNIEIERIY